MPFPHSKQKLSKEQESNVGNIAVVGDKQDSRGLLLGCTTALNIAQNMNLKQRLSWKAIPRKHGWRGEGAGGLFSVT